MTDYHCNEDDELPWLAEADDDYEPEPEQCEECGWEQRHCSCIRFADPTRQSALRAGKREHPCPSCGEPAKLTTADVGLGYRCADSAQGFGP